MNILYYMNTAFEDFVNNDYNYDKFKIPSDDILEY